MGIIDEQIFCAHGGIPCSVNKVEDLYKIPIPMNDPENQSLAAWEVSLEFYLKRFYNFIDLLYKCSLYI